MKGKKQMKAYWHIYHDQLLGFSDNIQERIKYIKRYKPKCETDLRLALLKPVQGKLPRIVIKSGESHEKARVVCEKLWIAGQEAWMTHPEEAFAAYMAKEEAYNKALAVYVKTQEAYNKTLKAYQAEIEALHKKECPNCPWDGKTIFPRKKEN